jgi:hypothetical protein
MNTQSSIKKVENLNLSEKLIFAFGGKNTVRTSVKNCTANEKINLSQLIDLIKSEPPKNALKVRSICSDGFNNNIASVEIKKQIKDYKSSLPYVLFSGFCPLHHNDKSLVYNGCVQIDIDFKEVGGDKKALKIKEAVKHFSFVALAAISPSGFGVKILVPTTNLDLKLHSKISKALIFDMSKMLKIKEIYFDNLGASQPCYIPFDKDVFVNPSVIEYNHFEGLYKYELHQRQQIEKSLLTAQKNAPVKDFDNNISVPKIEILKYLTGRIVASGLNVTGETGNYNNWFLVAQSFGCAGEVARSLFHTVAAIHSGYDFNENEAKFNEGLKHCKDNSIGFLVNECKSNGITINEFCRNWIKENAPKNNFNPFQKSKKQIEYHYNLLDNQYIGNVPKPPKFEIGLNYLIAGTGAGKTYFTAQNFEKTVIISRNITTLQNYEQYGFTQFKMENLKDNFMEIGDGSKITVTYKSLENLLSVLDKTGYTFIFDEYHLLVDSYGQIRKETSFAYDSISDLQKQNTVILSSANNVLLTDSRLKTKSKHIYKKPSVKRFCQVEYNAKYIDLEKTIFEKLAQGKKVLLYTNRKEKKEISEKLKQSFLERYSMFFFDATKHNNIDLSILENDITVCTKALVTGKDVMNDNIAMIIYCNDYDMKSSTINQFFGRARNYKTASYDLFFTFHPNNLEYEKPNIASLVFGCKNIANCVMEASVNDIAFLHENDKFFVRKIDGKMFENPFAIDNHIETQLSKCTIWNTSNLSDFLKVHGYECTFLYIENKTSEERVATDEIKPSEKYTNEIDEINKGNFDFDFETVAMERVEGLKKLGFSQKESLLFSLQFDTPINWIRFCKILLSETRLGTNDKQYKKDYEKILDVLSNEMTLNNIIKTVQKLRGSKTKIGILINNSKKIDLTSDSETRFFAQKMRFFYDVVVSEKKEKNQKLYSVNRTGYIKISDRSNILESDLKSLLSLSEFIKK